MINPSSSEESDDGNVGSKPHSKPHIKYPITTVRHEPTPQKVTQSVSSASNSKNPDVSF